MNERDHLAEQFEQARPHLRAVAYRMLGSTSDAEDAVQEAWLRLARSNADAIENLRGWLTTVVGRVCLDLLRARREEPSDSLPEPIVIETEGDDAQLLAGATLAAFQAPSAESFRWINRRLANFWS